MIIFIISLLFGNKELYINNLFTVTAKACIENGIYEFFESIYNLKTIFQKLISPYGHRLLRLLFSRFVFSIEKTI